ncbi:MAG: serine/threonine-protein kinase, partial [Isosphaeraceae bacterium]
MSLSASRRTWEEASSPAVVRLAREYERAWRDSSYRDRRPDPQTFLSAASASIDGPGARLALLRADMALRWEAGERVGARWYLERNAGLSEDTIVALAYEEFCLLEDDEQGPDPGEFLARYPEVAPALRRVLDIHGLVGPGTMTAGSLLGGTGSGEHACPFPEAGQTIAGFSLVEELGRGAFARVFLARERELADRPVALKVTRRGSREPQTLARLQHTHIVPVHSYRIDRATGLHLLCMPYFGRTTLARVLADAHKHDARTGAALVAALDRLEPTGGPAGGSSGRAALERRSYVRAIAWWGARLAEALEHAHDRGVLHRDIKPSNVLVTSDGMPMLLDFNLAREPLDGDAGETAPGGTVDYMSPEHLRALADGEPEGVDHRADIYGLGVVLYESLSGCRPFAPPTRGGSLIDALQRVAEERWGQLVGLREIEPDVPPALDRVVARCLAPDPRDRYQSAGELAADLRAVAEDQPLVHAREPWSSRGGGWLRRKRRGLTVAAALMLALFVSTFILLAATIGYLLMLGENSEIVQSALDRGEASLERRDYVAAQKQYESAQDLARHFGRMDPRNSSPSESLAMVPQIVRKLGSLRPTRDFNELRSEAIVKGTAAARHAEAEADAAKLHAAADRLRFRLLLELGGFPETSKEIRDALGLFFVLEQPDWTKLLHKYGLLKD